MIFKRVIRPDLVLTDETTRSAEIDSVPELESG